MGLICTTALFFIGLMSPAHAANDSVSNDVWVSEVSQAIEFRDIESQEVPVFAYMGVLVVGDIQVSRLWPALELATAKMNDMEYAIEIRNLKVAPFGPNAPDSWQTAEVIVYSHDLSGDNKCYTGNGYIISRDELDAYMAK